MLLMLMALIVVPWGVGLAATDTCGDTGDQASRCNDPAGVMITVSDASTTEGQGATLEFVVTLSHAHPTDAVTMDYETNGDETNPHYARAGTDYTDTSGTLTFAQGETTKSISVAVLNDALSEGIEYLKLELSNASKATFVRYGRAQTGDSAKGKILPDEEDKTAPTTTISTNATAPVSGSFAVDITFSEPVTGLEASELEITNGTVALLSTKGGLSGDGMFEWSAVITPTIGLSGNVTVKVPAGAATGYFDNTNTVSNTLEIEARGASAQGQKPVVLCKHEPDETWSFVEILGPGSATGLNVAVRIGFPDPSDPDNHDLVLLPNGAGLSAGDIAITDENDFSAGVGMLACRSSSVGNKHACVYGGQTRNGYPGTMQVKVLAGTLTDSAGRLNRASDPLYVAGRDWLVSASESTATRATDTTIDFEVALNARDDCRQVTVDWTTADGTAVAGTDYTSSSGTLTFEPGETTKSVSVPLLGSSASTGDKTLELRLSNVTGHMAGLGTAEATGTIEGPDVAPLTARFEALPQAHDGETAFTFQLHFSENVDGLSYRSVHYQLFHVTGGWVVKAQRLATGENRIWLVRVRPLASSGDIVITTRATQSCDAAHAVCTADGRKYAGGDSITVARDALSVADAQVREGADATLDFVVTLSRARSETTTVDYATSDGTAMAGADYTAASGTLTFAAGETSKTVSVTVLVDTEDEESETLSLTLSNAVGARIADAVATGTVTDEESQQPVRVLTASFHDVPAGHDGSKRFNFELHFSEEISLSYVSVRDALFDVSGGRVVKAQRLEAGKNRKWLVSVKPASSSDIVITTRATASCDAAHAVCTADGRSYSGGDGATVLGPLTPRELVGTAGDDTLNGAGGDDLLRGDLGADTLSGAGGDDTLHGDDGDPTITSPDEGNDVLYGDDGDDTLYGDAGDDDLYGGSDHDTLHGDRGDDTLYGDDGETDTNAGDDDLYGGSGEDSLYGDGGDDVLEGGADDDILEGGAGDDTLHGDDSADVLVTGDDELDGGPGADTLTGGPGADTFVFGAGHGSDTITDFSPDESDLIDVSAFAGITAFANLSLSDDESDTVLDLGSHGGGTVRLEGISAADLEAEDFVLPQ